MLVLETSIQRSTKIELSSFSINSLASALPGVGRENRLGRALTSPSHRNQTVHAGGLRVVVAANSFALPGLQGSRRSRPQCAITPTTACTPSKRSRQSERADCATGVNPLPECPPDGEDLRNWVQTDSRVAARIMRLMSETMREPFSGIGKPEPLTGEQGTWSRRITEEHRLPYRVTAKDIHFIQARFHHSR